MRDQQLPLHLKLPDHAVFDSFFAGPNREALNYLAGSPDAMTWLWGEPATGKTHLLQAAAAAVPKSAYLPLAEVREFGPSVLEGYDQFDVVCLDQLDEVIRNPDRHTTSSAAPAGCVQGSHTPRSNPSEFTGDAGDQTSWEQALFNLYRLLVVERQGRLIVASTVAPKTIEFVLPDLASRLLSGPVFRLHAMDDDERLQAIQLRASRRGLKLPDATGQYLLKRLQRDMSSLCEFLDRLDTASLVHQSRLTIPLVRKTLDQPAVDAR